MLGYQGEKFCVGISAKVGEEFISARDEDGLLYVWKQKYSWARLSVLTWVGRLACCSSFSDSFEEVSGALSGSVCRRSKKYGARRRKYQWAGEEKYAERIKGGRAKSDWPILYIAIIVSANDTKIRLRQNSVSVHSRSEILFEKLEERKELLILVFLTWITQKGVRDTA